jgi:hypothetical protein
MNQAYQITYAIDRSDNMIGQTALSLVGGVTSVITGGKFLSGAVSAAFVHLFNAEMKSIYRGKYKNSAAILRKMKNGDIVFGKRKLGRIIRDQDPLNDVLNTELVHEQIFFKIDGEIYNIGFSKGSWIANEAQDQYLFSEIYSVKNIERIINVMRFFNPNNYNILFNNCQHFADAVARQIQYDQGYK